MFETKERITWCPGCPNYLIKKAVDEALARLVKQGFCRKEELVMVTDIGCNSKIYDYLNLSGFYGLHGRTLPVALGIKIGNPKLKVICFGGDGGTYNEGVSHLVHACRYNQDINIFVFNNQVFSLTTGQATATTEEGFVEKTHPKGVKERPLNPIGLVLESGASFVARVSALDLGQMTEVFEEAVKHKGFSFVEILQPCLAYHDISNFLRGNVYKIERMALDRAKEEAGKWDYTQKGKAATGIFFKEERVTFAEKYLLTDSLKEF